MIIVNATSCKLGGAKQIVERFVDDYECPEKLIVIGPKSLNLPSKIYKHNTIETSGIMTMLFSILFVGWYVLRYRATTIFSFSNINLIIPLCDRITYFHQLKILTAKNLRFKAFRFIIRCFLIKSNTFIFQTKYVEKSFKEVFGPCLSKICWPGVHLPPQFFPKSKLGKLTALIPYAFIDLPQKNYNFFTRINWSLFDKLERVVITTLNDRNQIPVFEFIGHQSRQQMNDLYQTVDIMFISSIEETVCLPIFEFAATGKPVIVLSADYIVGIARELELPKNIIVIEPNEFEETLSRVLNDHHSFCEQNESKLVKILHSEWPSIL